MKTDQAIDDFLDAEDVAWGGMDMRSFVGNGIPNLFEFDPLIAKPWTETHTLPMMHAVQEKNVSYRDIGLLLHNPSTVRGMLLFDLLMAREAKIGTDGYLQVFDFYDEVLRALCPLDPMTKFQTNKIHGDSEIETLVSRCESADVQTARVLGQLANACYSLSHGLYSDMNPQLTYDNFGPYYLKNGNLFAFKIFRNLRPLELWPETCALPYDGFDIGLLFEDVTMTMDAATHAVYEGNQVTQMRGWWCEADGDRLGIDEIDAARRVIEDAAINVYVKVKKMATAEKKTFFCYQKAWGYKRLFDNLGLKWEPSPEVLKAMEGENLFNAWDIDSTTGMFTCPLRSILDPRHEIPADAFN